LVGVLELNINSHLLFEIQLYHCFSKSFINLGLFLTLSISIESGAFIIHLLPAFIFGAFIFSQFCIVFGIYKVSCHKSGSNRSSSKSFAFTFIDNTSQSVYDLAISYFVLTKSQGVITF